MTIRSRLLTLLLPMLIAFVALISLFFYHNWYGEIITSSKSHLQAISVSTAQSMDPQKISWINEHLADPDLEKSDLYQRYQQKLSRLKEKLPVANLYIIRVDPIGGAYRQVYLMDLSDQHRPGDSTPSEPQIQAIYYTHQPFVRDNRDVMTAYSPITDPNGQVVALVAADLDLKLIDQKLHRALMIIFVSAAFTIILVIMGVYFIANKISKPVQKLKNAALAIAAGDYAENIQVEGPHEIVELANTLNTMSECLLETISRLQESSFVRERMHGEYECALLLQQMMLEQVVQDFESPRVQLRSLKSASTHKPYGLKLKVETIGNAVHFQLMEAKQPGFQGMYELLTEMAGVNFPVVNAVFGESRLSFSAQEQMPNPIVWATTAKNFAEENEGTLAVHSGDYLFFYNQGFAKFFENHVQILAWFGKVLKHFGSEELDLLMTMLKNELSFLSKKHHVEHDMHILCVKIE